MGFLDRTWQKDVASACQTDSLLRKELHSTWGFKAQRDRPVHTLEGEAAERIGDDLAG
jgi:hypothetical protein